MTVAAAALPEVERILFATDFSPDADLALGHAREAARRFGAEVVLLHVDETQPDETQSDETQRDAGPSAAKRALDARAPGDDPARRLDRAADELTRAGIRVSTLVRRGDPAREILLAAAAERAGLIVLATHGGSRSRSLLLGRVADRVVRHAAVPVLIVRHPARILRETASAVSRQGSTSSRF